MKCNFCGLEIEDNAKMCMYCGHTVEPKKVIIKKQVKNNNYSSFDEDELEEELKEELKEDLSEENDEDVYEDLISDEEEIDENEDEYDDEYEEEIEENNDYEEAYDDDEYARLIEQEEELSDEDYEYNQNTDTGKITRADDYLQDKIRQAEDKKNAPTKKELKELKKQEKLEKRRVKLESKPPLTTKQIIVGIVKYSIVTGTIIVATLVGLWYI